MQHNTLPLTGKTVLITGSAKRIGATVARFLHAKGSNIVIHYRSSADSANTLCSELCEDRADSAITVQADLLDNESGQGLVDKTLASFGGLDLLINNASSFYPTPVGSVTDQAWDDLMGSNLRAPFFLSQIAAPYLAKNRGSIINMVDIHAKKPLAQHPVYCAAKAGLVMMTLSLAKELGPDIRVNGVAPGAILWPEAETQSMAQKKIIDATALKRVGNPEDIANTIFFLTHNAPYITGQIIAVDGGRSLGW